MVRRRGLSFFCGTPHGDTWLCVLSPGAGLLSSPSCLTKHRFQDPRAGALPPASRSPCDQWEPLEDTDGFGAGSQIHLVAEGRPFPAPQAPKLCFGSRAPMDPTDLGHPNTQVPGNQGRWPLGLRAGVGGPPASRRPCSLVPGFPAQGAQPCLCREPREHGSPEPNVSMVQPDVQAVPWLVSVSFFPSGNRFVWWQDRHP